MKGRTIYGIGINDLPKSSNSMVYKTWHNMIRRCYDIKSKNTRPTYNNCFVCKEWLTFSNFKEWFDSNYHQKYCLDKDILIEGNKIYSPESCRFIPNYINVLLTDRANDRGKYLIGASFSPRHNKYKAYISLNHKVTYLGYFNTEMEAHNKWAEVKKEYVNNIALKALIAGDIKNDIYSALLLRTFM